MSRTERIVGKPGAAAGVAVFFHEKFAKAVVAGADDERVVGLLDLRAFDGQS